MWRRFLVSLLVCSAALGPGLAPSAMAAAVAPITVAQADDGSSTGDAPSDGNPLADPGTPGTPDPSVPWWRWQNSDPLTLPQQFQAGTIYDLFWNDRTQAFATPSYESELMLGDNMDGAPLAGDVAALRQLEGAGQAQIVKVDHHSDIRFVGDSDLVIYDSYVDHSYLVDAKTQQPVTGGPPANPPTLNMAYHFRKFPFPDPRSPYTWKVADAVQVTN